MVTKHNLFRPSKAESKADATTTVAKGIIEAETSAREAKVERLRRARLDRDASEAKAEAPKTPSKAKRAKS